MKAVITSKKEIAAGSLEVELKTNEKVDFVAGQFFSLSLINPPFTDERGNQRKFGFVNSPRQNKNIKFVTRMGPSAFKKSLQEADIGTEVEIDGIYGDTILPEDTSVPLVIIAGGIGIAPYMSMLKDIEERSLYYKVNLIYANTNRISAMYLDDLETITKNNPKIKLVAELTGGTGLKEEVVKSNLGTDKTMYFISGTVRFVPAIVKMLRKLGVLSGQMKFEIFTGY
jgi:ferredoxin-NADP reductase